MAFAPSEHLASQERPRVLLLFFQTLGLTYRDFQTVPVIIESPSITQFAGKKKRKKKSNIFILTKQGRLIGN